MAAKLTTLCIDASDVEKVAAFWSAVLGWDHFVDDDGDMVVADRTGHSPFILLVLGVPEKKTVKNRLHIDLNPVGADQDAELERLVSLGARPVDIGQGDTTWVVLADPEGNEFCLLRRRLDAEGA
jgi:predicted enzyme related to lactoylglutathione lyase